MKTVLVTGGVRGIGKSIADAFKKKGYRVCVTYSKDEENATTDFNSKFNFGLSTKICLKRCI